MITFAALKTEIFQLKVNGKLDPAQFHAFIMTSSSCSRVSKMNSIRYRKLISIFPANQNENSCFSKRELFKNLLIKFVESISTDV